MYFAFVAFVFPEFSLAQLQLNITWKNDYLRVGLSYIKNIYFKSELATKQNNKVNK